MGLQTGVGRRHSVQQVWHKHTTMHDRHLQATPRGATHPRHSPPFNSPARHLWREGRADSRIALDVAAVLLVLWRVARAAPAASPREPAPPGVPIGLLPAAMLHVLRVVLLLLLLLRHRQVKHVIWQRCSGVL